MATPALDSRVRLQEGGLEDLDNVMRVMDAAFGDAFGEAWTRSQCTGILPMAGVALVIARDRESGETVGFALSRTVVDDSELLLLAVEPEQHRKGIGTQLLEDFVSRARAQGAIRLHLEVRDGNPAVGMYQAAGFAPAGRRRDYYRGRDGRRSDALTLVLSDRAAQ